MSKAVRGVMRDREGFQTLIELQAAVMAQQGMDAANSAMAAVVRKRIGAALRNFKRRGRPRTGMG